MSFPWNIRPFIKSYERLWSARRTRRIPQHGAWKMHELNSVKRGTKTSINQPWSITQGKQQAGIHPWKTYVKSENTIRKEKYQAKTHPILLGFGACDREFLTGGALPMGFLGILRENRSRARLLHLQYARVARWLVVVVDGGGWGPSYSWTFVAGHDEGIQIYGKTTRTHTGNTQFFCSI